LLASFVCHAVALHFGQLSVVQPLLVTELIFALLLRRIRHGEPVGRPQWLAAAATCTGLAVLLGAIVPGPSRSTPTVGAWIEAVVLIGALAAGTAMVAHLGPRRLRAGLFGAAAGLVWAIDAAFIKSTTDVLATDGWWPMFWHWPVYALVGSGAVGIVLLQAALHAGPLSASQPVVAAVDPLASIVLGAWLFDESIRTTPTTVVISVLAFVVMIVGVAVMARGELPSDDRELVAY